MVVSLLTPPPPGTRRPPEEHHFAYPVVRPVSRPVATAGQRTW